MINMGALYIKKEKVNTSISPASSPEDKAYGSFNNDVKVIYQTQLRLPGRDVLKKPVSYIDQKVRKSGSDLRSPEALRGG